MRLFIGRVEFEFEFEFRLNWEIKLGGRVRESGMEVEFMDGLEKREDEDYRIGRKEFKSSKKKSVN